MISNVKISQGRIKNLPKDIEDINNRIDNIGTTAGDSSPYATSLDPDLEMQSPFNSLPAGTTVQDLLNLGDISSILDLALFPEILAFISNNESNSISGISTSLVEVGTTIPDFVISTNFNRGKITNGNKSIAGDVVGGVNRILIKSNSDNGVLFDDDNIASDSGSYTLSGFKVLLGTNNFKLQSFHDSGSTSYYTNKDLSNPSNNLLSRTSSGSLSVNSSSIPGRYYWYIYLGARNSSPSISNEIRDLTKTF